MRPLSTGIAAALLAAACAGRAGGPCEPVPAAIALAAGTEVFAECAVERKAVARTALKLDYSPMALPTASAGRVVLEFVVDSTGLVIASTIREVESTDRAFTEAYTNALLKQRFRPATIGGRPVAQLTSTADRYERRAVVVRRAP